MWKETLSNNQRDEHSQTKADILQHFQNILHAIPKEIRKEEAVETKWQ